MKKILAFAFLALMAGPLRPAFAADLVYNAELVNDTCIAADTNYDLSLAGINQISFTSSYSTTTPSADTFTDGRKSTATVTISTNSALSRAAASVQFTILTNSSSTIAGKILTLGGYRFKAGPGGEWQPVATATGSAINLAAAIDANANFDAVAVSTVVYATATVAGSYANAWTATTNAPTVISTSAPTMTGGQDNHRFTLNGVTFDAATAYTVGASSAATGSAICAAILANSTLTADLTCSTAAATPGIITLTAAAVGETAYPMFTSLPGAFRLNGSATSATATFGNGATSKVDLTNDLINLGAHRFGTGLDVLYSTAGSNGIGGLTNQTTYYVIKNDYDRVKLATSKANAAAGTAINLTTQVGGQTYTLTPLARTGNPSFKWQASNNSTFVDLSVSSVTITSSSTAAWDFGILAYKTLRLKFATSTTGCASVTATGTGRR